MTAKFITKIMAVAFAALLVCSNASFAEGGRLSVGAEVGLPMGDFGDIANTGFGGSLRFELPLMGSLALTGTAGYLSFSGKDFFDGISLYMIPVQVGAKYYFNEQQGGFYGMVELGMHSSGSNIEGSESETNFSYAPALGYHLDNIDIGLKYQNVDSEGSTTSYLGLRLAYVLGSK